MRLRVTRPSDFEPACDFILPGYGYCDEMRRKLPEIWRHLYANGQMNSGVVEDTALDGVESIRGVGISYFVTERFADEVLSNPKPFLSDRLHREILAGHSPVLDRHQIAEGNNGAGLSLMPIHFATRSIDITDEYVFRTLNAAQEIFHLCHAGYRVRRVFKEVAGTDLCRFMIGTGMEMHSDYRDLAVASVPSDIRPYLLAVNHADLPLGTPMSMMFNPGPMKFDFSPGEQRMLFAAVLGGSDEEIAEELDIGLDTIRKHWRSVYERVLMADPSFFERDGIFETDGAGRGKGKRRLLLRYLNLHMEELRPHVRQRPERTPIRSGDLAGFSLPA